MSRFVFYMTAVALLLFSGCAPRKVEEVKSAPVPVRVMKVERTRDIVLKRYVGTAAPSKSATLSGKHSGTLVSLNVSRGDKVKKGDVIAVIESQSVSSMAETTEATLRQAEDGYERARRMYEKGGLADVKMVEIETQLAQARAAAKAASKAVDDCTIRAPFDGTVSDVLAEEGTEVSALAPVARIYDISSMEIRFSVPENEIGNIKVGDAASVEVPALGTVSLDGTRSVEGFTAEIEEKGISGSPLSHSYECTLVPSGECRNLMPGMVCKIRMSNDSEGGFVLPAALIRADASGKYVWGLTENRTVRKIYVTAGGFASRGVVVTSGLEEGDLVITEGIQKVSTGMSVDVLE